MVEEVVKEMNRLGIMVDVSHVTDEVINQVMDMTDVPVILHTHLVGTLRKDGKGNVGTMKLED